MFHAVLSQEVHSYFELVQMTGVVKYRLVICAWLGRN